MEFGYATSVDDIFDTPPAKSDWTEDDVEEGRPLLRVGSWYRGGVCVRLRLRPIGATVARQIPVLKVTRSNRVSVTVRQEEAANGTPTGTASTRS